MGDISGTTGPTKVVHLPKFTEFCKGIGGNVVFVVTLGSIIHILNKKMQLDVGVSPPAFS